MNKLPIYDIVLKEDDLKQGVGRISLVDEPAIGVDWITLKKQPKEDCTECLENEGPCWEGYEQVGMKIVDGKEVPNCVPVVDGKPEPPTNFKIEFKSNKEKQLLYGPFLIPNMLIYRKDDQNGEYYVRFSAEEIDKIATKFNEDLNSKNINLMHTDEMVDAFVAQNWVIEGDQDKSRGLGFDLPEGTWFGAVKVKDQNFWNEKVKKDEVKGFSVEILADLQLSLKNKEQIMEKQIKLGSATLKDGVTVYWDGEFGMGTAIFVDEALTQAAPDAEHVLEDGTIVTTQGGLVTEIQVPSIEEGEDLQVEPNSAQALTAEEVSGMIDARFADLMEEISRLKSLLDEKQTEMNSFRTEVNEKFSTVPGVTSIKKPEVVRPIDNKFKETEARIKEFARTLKK